MVHYLLLIHASGQGMRVVAAAAFMVGGRGKSRLAQTEMSGVFVPGANQGSEAFASLTAWKGFSSRDPSTLKVPQKRSFPGDRGDGTR
ncbi:hypothetical protein I532_07605 [Brevibacillus borstelensis AK1]|uniref:Uncharacterized protein n=1 Tax=Brevibacillus borstelensis AK1 TaxID=1300222 RepID=M8DJS5_9BACL|nr:hypothetical protein I532_07605 [Brevibacillus borstelensis AK1]